MSISEVLLLFFARNIIASFLIHINNMNYLKKTLLLKNSFASFLYFSPGEIFSVISTLSVIAE